MNKFLYSLTFFFLFCMSATSANAASTCSVKVKCTTYPTCIKRARSMYNACRKEVATLTNQCLVELRHCQAKCRRISSSTGRGLCNRKCTLRYRSRVKSCYFVARKHYRRCSEGYSFAKRRCARPQYKMCRGTAVSERSICLRVRASENSRCLRNANTGYSRCVASYTSCTKRCRFINPIRAISNAKNAVCRKGCKTRHSVLLLRCRKNLVNARRKCRRSYSSAKRTCNRKPATSCRNLRCGPCNTGW